LSEATFERVTLVDFQVDFQVGFQVGSAMDFESEPLALQDNCNAPWKRHNVSVWQTLLEPKEPLIRLIPGKTAG